jgi:hypothetical protein
MTCSKRCEELKMIRTDLEQMLWNEAKELVKRMNPYEARKFPGHDTYWPDWARRDLESAFLAFKKILTDLNHPSQ